MRSECFTRRSGVLVGTALMLLATSDASAKVGLGAYECWAFSSPRMDLNFEVTDDHSYVASDGSAGTFKFDPETQSISFTGYLGDVMPEGFTTIYHEPNGRPTVSFRGRGGAEASFCERP
jgi:hypothetical protein